MIIKKFNFHQELEQRDIQSQITLKKFPRSLRSRLLGGHCSIYEHKH